MAEYQEYLDFAIDLGRKAGEMIKDGQAKRFSHDSSLDTKANAIDATHKKVPVVGVIMMPFLDQLFSARVGGGAYLNEATALPLTGRPQPLETLQECVVSFECESPDGHVVIRPPRAQCKDFSSKGEVTGARLPWTPSCNLFVDLLQTLP
ncbi:hypothetical protein QFC22_002739 [Naganishia vaughanmartiniae]|uniref:Uncharacterized protein n=1 Tax=Naganishia vaughanmartiniae TaxID=1424756 RepID=A0ACC2X9W1_9TREE|nr:hypothetical protein QFC22_002739 [Naganishia vaughanmartiniae]